MHSHKKFKHNNGHRLRILRYKNSNPQSGKFWKVKMLNLARSRSLGKACSWISFEIPIELNCNLSILLKGKAQTSWPWNFRSLHLQLQYLLMKKETQLNNIFIFRIYFSLMIPTTPKSKSSISVLQENTKNRCTRLASLCSTQLLKSSDKRSTERKMVTTRTVICGASASFWSVSFRPRPFLSLPPAEKLTRKPFILVHDAERQSAFPC